MRFYRKRTFMTLMYIHGYGSTGQAYKAKLLQEMFPDHHVVSPTLDYDRESPSVLLDQLKTLIDIEQPEMIMGSSMGGYYALCCMNFYKGKIWCINPVRDILATLRFLAQSNPAVASAPIFAQRMKEYEVFNQQYFAHLQAANGQLHLALSLDDEVLGSHTPLQERFPNAAEAINLDHCGHRFLRFAEIKEAISKSLATK